MNDNSFKNNKILVLEKNVSLAFSIYRTLSHNSRVYIAKDVESTLDKAQTHSFDLIIIDFDQPKNIGPDIIDQIRSLGINSKIMIINRTDDFIERIACFDKGASFYFIKPFLVSELNSVVNNLLREKTLPNKCNYLSAEMIIDCEKLIVIRGKTKIQLRKKEFLILECLFRNAGRVISKEDIIKYVWDNKLNNKNCVEVHIKNLRQKIDASFKKKTIITFNKQGYMLKVTRPRATFTN